MTEQLCKNPKLNADGTIDVEVNYPVYGWIPFTASPNDSESHGLLIYQAALSGAYGEVAPYVKSEAEYIFEALAERDRRVYEIDKTATNPILWNALTQEEQQAFSDKRAALLGLTAVEMTALVGGTLAFHPCCFVPVSCNQHAGKR